MEKHLKEMICEVGKRIYENGLVAANDGNITVRIDKNVVLTTPTGVSKGYMTPEMILKVDLEGNLLEKSEYKPSSELKMHLRVYKLRPDVNAVVHAHPPYATVFSFSDVDINKPILTESTVLLGKIGIAPYATPSTEEVPNSIEDFLISKEGDAVLLSNHGALTFAHDLMAAYFRMESLEFHAKLLFISLQLGTPKTIKEDKLKELYQIRNNLFGM